ncbi:unnamed protein product [Diatraea saccharalis]|uniref:Uncharacterized protein n=1 Tax=Diatraea saccharalis TaxID=40085 RepID=A0A9N9R739_9NEOP|nr:unnamed protein product [Diatraea saccharalis]
MESAHATTAAPRVFTPPPQPAVGWRTAGARGGAPVRGTRCARAPRVTVPVLYRAIHKDGAKSDGDFRPIPIPLDQWNYEKREARVGTLQETIKTDKATTVAAVPAHYWEDALRHSVYLTLVRDKIDQLIAKGIVISPDTKPDPHTSKEVDDRDLWEKIKKAPFDRIKEDDHASYGDVTIMAKGRLLEESGGYRFTEDERSKEDCKDEMCMKGVKAFWSVKRVRQRDEETSAGKYHYELTFSVNSQPPKKQRKPFETPVRTFTVRENPPDIIVAQPEEKLLHQTPFPQAPRPQRAIWFHRNIAPGRQNFARHHHQGLDRIFSAFFSDDDSYVEPSPKYKPNPYVPPIYSHHSKLGHAGPLRDQNHQKKVIQYPYTPNMYKYSRPPLQTPPLSHVQHHYIDMDAVVNHQQIPPLSDHRHISPSNIIKTTRPAVLPTPPYPSFNTTIRNSSLEFDTDNKFNVTHNTTLQPELPPVYKPYNKPRPQQVKFNHFPDRIRPPVYNAPPGVFLSMDKKLFKPMPPLKYMQGSKPIKRPTDFRPSPQVFSQDGQLSDPDTTIDSAFRPILINVTDKDNFEKIKNEVPQNNKHLRKPGTKKPPKKHENIKSHQITTSVPDIITLYNSLDEDNDTMQWANILGAFTKTTPMASQKNKQKLTESTTQPMIINDSAKTSKNSTTAIFYQETIKTSTVTPISKKRTRPPHKFTKPEKIKKHKRLTTTTTAPEKIQRNKTADLTPQASSAANGANKTWQPKNKTATMPTTTTSVSITTQNPSPSTTKITTISSMSPLSTTMLTTAAIKPAQQISKNRFRQSTLMIKGTSVKHDRWSNNASSEKKLLTTTIKNSRRNGSNFHGYGSTSTRKYSSPEDFMKEHENENNRKIESTTSDSQSTPLSTQLTYEETVDHYVNEKSTVGYSQNYEDDNDDDNNNTEIKSNNNEEQETEDHSEFIFDLTPKTPNDESNEINEDDLIVTEQSIIATSHTVSKNKTRCKKKKHQNLVPTELSTTEETSTTKSSTNFLDELLGSFSDNEPTVTTKESRRKDLEEGESENHDKYIQIDDDFDDFLDSFGDSHRHRHSDERGIEDYEDDEKETSIDDEVSPFDNDDVNEPRKSNDKDYDEYQERPYSLLELMAME